MTSHERAVEVDTELARIWDEQGDARYRIAQSIDALHRSDGQKIDHWSGRKTWDVSDEDTEISVRGKLVDHASDFWYEVEPGRTVLMHNGKYAQRRIDEIDEQRARLLALAEDARPLNAEYIANLWPRFFLVQNAGGHIHSSMSCNTTFPTTRWGWLPDLSGLTEADAVAQEGPRLCSICYPSAPVEWTLGLPKTPKCPGSGQTGERFGRTRYGACPTCGKSFALSSTGAVRAHKPQEA